MSAWELVKSDRYEEAEARFSDEASVKPSAFIFRNRGMTRLLLGKFAEALADFRAADEMHRAVTKASTDGDMCGAALWIAGREEEAIAVWSAGVEASLMGAVKYADMAGGVTIGNLLMFAAVSRKDTGAQELATRLLKKRLRAKQSAAWPGPTSRYLLDQISEADMRSKVSAVPILKERQSCQAEFYIGVRARLAEDVSGFFASMRRAADFGRVAKLEVEYYLALHESERRADKATEPTPTAVTPPAIS